MIDVAFLGTAVRPAGTAVIIDVLRATSTITLALASGYERVLVAGSIDAASALRAPRPRARRRGGLRAGAGLRSRQLARGDAHAARARARARHDERRAGDRRVGARVCDDVLIASLLNLDAVCAQLAGREDVLLVCAGTDGRVSIEDVYLAGRLSATLEGPRTDAARVAEAVAAAYPSARDALEASGGAVGLRREGLESDIAFCAQESIVDVVGRLTEMVDGAAAADRRRGRRAARADSATET